MITSILGIKAPRTDECLPYTVWLWHGHRTRVIVTFFPDHSQISIWSEFVAASSVVSAIEINISRENILRFSQASNYLFIILKKIYFTFIYLFFKWRWYEIRMAEERLNTAGLRKVWQRSVYVLQSVYTGNYKKKKKNVFRHELKTTMSAIVCLFMSAISELYHVLWNATNLSPKLGVRSSWVQLWWNVSHEDDAYMVSKSEINWLILIMRELYWRQVTNIQFVSVCYHHI